MCNPRSRKAADYLFRFFSPINVLIPFAVIFFFGATVHGETWHVKPSSEVPIRSGQGTEYKILAVVPDGFMVELVEENDPWAMVRTPGGTEGWMLKRYLSSDPPLSEMVDTLRAQKVALEKKEEATSLKYDELESAYSKIEQEYNACLADRDDLSEKYQTLQEDTADVIKIKKSLVDSTREIQSVTQKLAAVEQENQSLKKNSAVKWFMAGGLVLILGWLIGLMTGRSRKKKSSLY